MKCPRCKSANASTQRRMDGDSQCLDCGYRAKTTTFQAECTDAYTLGYAEGQRDAEKIKNEALQSELELHRNAIKAMVNAAERAFGQHSVCPITKTIEHLNNEAEALSKQEGGDDTSKVIIRALRNSVASVEEFGKAMGLLHGK